MKTSPWLGSSTSLPASRSNAGPQGGRADDGSGGVGSVQLMVFFPALSMESCVSVSFAVRQRASTVSDAQARRDTSKRIGNDPLWGDWPASLMATTFTSASPSPISRAAVVVVVVL